jgi:hypothetical protein
MPLYVYQCPSGHETTLLRPLAARNVPHTCVHPVGEGSVVPLQKPQEGAVLAPGEAIPATEASGTLYAVCGLAAQRIPALPGAVNGNFTERFYGR